MTLMDDGLKHYLFMCQTATYFTSRTNIRLYLWLYRLMNKDNACEPQLQPTHDSWTYNSTTIRLNKGVELNYRQIGTFTEIIIIY